MKVFCLVSVLVLAIGCQVDEKTIVGEHPQVSGWQDLFSVDLSNAENPGKVWTVTDGVLTADKDVVLWTTKTYDNFILNLKHHPMPIVAQSYMRVTR